MHDPPLCTLKELKDGTYNLMDLADFHEAMDEEAEYNLRDQEQRERNK
jgi:hypothetical protein